MLNKIEDEICPVVRCYYQKEMKRGFFSQTVVEQSFFDFRKEISCKTIAL